MTKKFIMLNDRILRGEVCAKKGDAVYEAAGYDYGLARDDSIYTRVAHISVSLKEDGSIPTFTVPTKDLGQA